MPQGELFARRLLTGPAGSGKTDTLLHLFLQQPRPGSALLVVPTISFREHTRNTLLRLGSPALTLLEGRGVVTFDDLQTRPATLSSVRRDFLVRRILAAIPHLGEVANFPGFRRQLAAEAEEVLAAGIAPARITGPGAFCDFLRRYEQATALFRCTSVTTASPELLLVDGFTDFTHEQKKILAVLIGRAARAYITLPEGGGKVRDLLIKDYSFAEETLTGNHRGVPHREAVACHDRRAEVELAADRILDWVHSGRQFREIGLIVQNPTAYVPTISSVFRGRGIPVRLFFPTSAAGTSLGRHLLACLRSVRDVGALLDPLKSAWSLVADRDEVSRLDYRMIEGKGPGDFAPDFFRQRQRLAEERDRCRSVTQMAKWVIDVWESLSAFGEIRSGLDHAQALDLRADALAKRYAWELPGEIAEAADAEGVALTLAEFCAILETELAETRFRVRDRRTDAVNVMNAYEARQWELRAVLLLGLVDGEFPRTARSTLFLSEGQRMELGLPTSQDYSREQERLFDVAMTRAREDVVITWPRTSGGASLLPSRFVENMSPVVVPLARAPVHRRRDTPPEQLRSTAVLERLRETCTQFNAYGFQSFAQCPFQYFAKFTLHLTGRPEQERGITPKKAGTIVHDAICAWEREGGDISAHFDHAFARYTQGIAMSSTQEKLRARMRADLRRFVDSEAEVRQRYLTRLAPRFLEAKFDVPLTLLDGAEVRLKGRVDSIETREVGGATLGVAVDFKYKATKFTKKIFREIEEGFEFQIPMYLLAMQEQFGLRAAGIELWNLRGDMRRAGVLEELLVHDVLTGPAPTGSVTGSLAPLVEGSRAKMATNAAAIRAGRIEVNPHESTYCKKGGCDFYDLCRVPKWKL